MPSQEINVATATDWWVSGPLIAAVIVALFGSSVAAWFKRFWLGHNLKVEFGLEPPYCHYTRIDGGKVPAFWVMFCIHNEGMLTARSCQVFLEEILTRNRQKHYDRDKSFWSTPLKWEGSQLKDIHGGSRAFANLGYVAASDCQEQSFCQSQDSSEGGLLFHFDLRYEQAAKTKYVRPGAHRLKVTIVGENFRPFSKKVDLDWRGKWKEKEAEMLKELTIGVSDWPRLAVCS